jgi:uncharacterized protein
MKIAVTGSSGLIGSALVRSLRADGHDVLRLVRRPARAADEVEWDPRRQYVDTGGLIGCEALVHLAGAGIGNHRWTEAYKKELRDSRLLGTAAVAEAVASLDVPPRVLVSGSAIGFYGDTGDRAVDESAPPGGDFLARLCEDWEDAAAAAREAGIRTVFPRTGLVVARRGGAWGPLFAAFRSGVGGRFGSGRQYWSFIALHDQVAALRHLIDTETLDGPVNLTAPHPVTNAEVAATMGRALHRPALLPVPAAALRLALGEMAGQVLASQRVLPARLLESGFAFAFPRLRAAIDAAA